jgi:pyruvate dehydrogenase E2 component (dihydrolipoamide acetyltransferase)
LTRSGTPLVTRAITDQPVPADAGLAWRKSMTLSLTVDHRAVDGAPAARFLAGVADRLQAPEALR